nr:hypothetical protein [uncultured Duganella sp.]
MMKVANDNKTMELPMPGAKRGRGRPPTGNAMTNAERQAAFKARRKANPPAQTPPRDYDQIELETERARIAMIECALKAANERIKALEKENALLVTERAAAFKAAYQAKEDMERITTSTSNSGKLASQVLKLEAALHQANADAERQDKYAEWANKQMAGYVDKIKRLEAEAKSKNRNASRKKVSDSDPIKTLKGE